MSAVFNQQKGSICRNDSKNCLVKGVNLLETGGQFGSKWGVNFVRNRQLKLIAWSDRPEVRDNDPFDILSIIENYFLFNLDEILEFHSDLLNEDEIDQLIIAARVLGRKSAKILQKSDKLSERILKILNENTFNPLNSSFIKKWIQKRDWTVEYAVKILNELKTGILE